VGAPIIKVTTVGIDLAKNVFQVHGVDAHGKAVLKKQIRRDQLILYFRNLPACLIGIASAHYRSRRLQDCGHTVRPCLPR
jgi:transposase